MDTLLFYKIITALVLYHVAAYKSNINFRFVY